MMIAHVRGDDGIVRLAADPREGLVDTGLVWLDLSAPTEAEEALAEAALGLEAPTRAERDALEESARFYEEDGALVLIPTIVARDAAGTASRHPVAFVLARGRLLTVRDCSPRAFEVGQGRASARISGAVGAADAMQALLEGLVERTADQVQETVEAVEALSRATLGARREPRLARTLRDLGGHGVSAAQCRDALASLTRAARFALAVAGRHHLDAVRLQALIDDATGLQRLAEALMADLTFLLDAVLGLVGARQNETLKVMAVVTLLFVPPTLIASVFGMNFTHMAVLEHPHGFTMAMLAMLVSAVGVLALGRLGRWL